MVLQQKGIQGPDHGFLPPLEQQHSLIFPLWQGPVQRGRVLTPIKHSVVIQRGLVFCFGEENKKGRGQERAGLFGFSQRILMPRDPALQGQQFYVE